jgi:hypothetical protein
MAGLEPSQVTALSALVLGFAFAGFVASAFQAMTQRPASFRLLNSGGWAAFASVPLLMTAAPVIIMRNTIRGRRFERRSMIVVMLATIIACLWSMVSGRVVLSFGQHLLGL